MLTKIALGLLGTLLSLTAIVAGWWAVILHRPPYCEEPEWLCQDPDVWWTLGGVSFFVAIVAGALAFMAWWAFVACKPKTTKKARAGDSPRA